MTLPAVARYVGQLLYNPAQQLYAARAEPPPPAAEAERAPHRASVVVERTADRRHHLRIDHELHERRRRGVGNAPIRAAERVPVRKRHAEREEHAAVELRVRVAAGRGALDPTALKAAVKLRFLEIHGARLGFEYVALEARAVGDLTTPHGLVFAPANFARSLLRCSLSAPSGRS